MRNGAGRNHPPYRYFDSPGNSPAPVAAFRTASAADSQTRTTSTNFCRILRPGGVKDWRWGGRWLARQRVRFAGGEWRRRNAVRVGRQDPFTRLLVARSSAFCLVAAAGVMLGRDQRQPGAGRSRFGLRGTAEGRQHAENRDICGEYADSNRSDDGYADNDGHQERNHDPPIPGNVVFCPGRGWALRPSAARILNLTCVDAPRC